MKRFAVLVLAAVLLAPAAIAAHEGHNHKTLGTVSAIHENHLEVKDEKGKVTTFALEPTTKIRRAAAKAGVGDIKVGDRVVVTARESKDKAGKVTVNVVDVQIGVPKAVPTAKKE
jgi:hypothetical protein